jgi:N-acetylneuraminate synthase
MIPTLYIGRRAIGPSAPCYIIAEMSANHCHSFDKAVEIIRAASDAGADAVKLQTYTPDTITIDCANEYFQIGKGTIWEGKNLYQLYGEACTPWDWQPKLKTVADELGLDCFSSPFDCSAVDFLEKMNVPAHKIASFELVDLALIRKVAQTGKPVIMSTGMATLAEIDEAVRTLRAAGCNQLALLKCTSAYPSPPEEMNLCTIPHLAEAFGVPAGLSDHTLGIAVPVAAVALGACIIEKHFTLRRSDGGPDAAFSLEPAEFKAMVDAIRIAEKALGRVNYEVTEKEKASRVFRRSLFVVKDMKAGEVFTKESVRSIRPGYGLAPRYLDQVIGLVASRDIERGTPLSWDLVSATGHTPVIAAANQRSASSDSKDKGDDAKPSWKKK